MSSEVKMNLKRGFFLTSLTSCILCFTKSLEKLNVDWIVCLIPALISIILFIIIGQLEISYCSKNIGSKSANILAFILYNFSLPILVFVVLIGLKIDETLTVQWFTVFIPLWYSLFAYFGFCVFMFPGMLDPLVKLKREAWTMAAFLVNIIVLSMLLCIWLSEGIEHLWYGLLSTIILVPISLCLKVYVEI